MPFFKRKRREANGWLDRALQKGQAKRVYRVLIRDPWVGIKEDYWELSEQQVESFVDEEDTAYVSCHYENGQPEYSFVAKTLWERWDEVSKILLNPALSPEEQAKAIEELAGS